MASSGDPFPSGTAPCDTNLAACGIIVQKHHEEHHRPSPPLDHNPFCQPRENTNNRTSLLRLPKRVREKPSGYIFSNKNPATSFSSALNFHRRRLPATTPCIILPDLLPPVSATLSIPSTYYKLRLQSSNANSDRKHHRRNVRTEPQSWREQRLQQPDRTSRCSPSTVSTALIRYRYSFKIPLKSSSVVTRWSV